MYKCQFGVILYLLAAIICRVGKNQFCRRHRTSGNISYVYIGFSTPQNFVTLGIYISWSSYYYRYFDKFYFELTKKDKKKRQKKTKIISKNDKLYTSIKTGNDRHSLKYARVVKPGFQSHLKFCFKTHSIWTVTFSAKLRSGFFKRKSSWDLKTPHKKKVWNLQIYDFEMNLP